MKRTENTVYDIDFSDFYPDVIDVNSLPKNLNGYVKSLEEMKKELNRLKKQLEML